MSFVSKIQEITAAANYSVFIELNEKGSSDTIAEIVLPKKVVEGLKGLDKKKDALLKKLLKEAFTKVALL